VFPNQNKYAFLVFSTGATYHTHIFFLDFIAAILGEEFLQTMRHLLMKSVQGYIKTSNYVNSTLKLEAEATSKTPVTIYKTTRYKPNSQNENIHNDENLVPRT
jgi:hypothetical protein